MALPELSRERNFGSEHGKSQSKNGHLFWQNEDFKVIRESKETAAVSCSATGPGLGGAGFRSGTTGKLGRA